MTLYTGVRLNNSTELLVDIEEPAAPLSAPASASPAIPISISCAILSSAKPRTWGAA